MSSTVDWLLDPSQPVVRRLALRTLLDRPAADPDVVAIDARLADDPWIAPLLAPARRGGPGSDEVHPYSKWRGAHWRLITLADLGLTTAVPGIAEPVSHAFDHTAAWLLSPSRLRRIRPLEGRVRGCASQEGGALWAACRLGLGDDPRVERLAALLVARQWPDGGWNCDVRPEAAHSSFNESWQPLGGLAAYIRARRQDGPGRRFGPDLGAAVDRTADFLIRHRVIESERTGEVANPRLPLLRWPAYWHYGLVPGLQALAEAGRLADPAVRPALGRLLERRAPDGRWRPDGRWWAAPGSAAKSELVDWGTDGESRMLTLHALRILGID